MADKQTTKRRGGGGKLARSEQVSIRLDPKLRFAAELAASKERRTLSSFIESAVERAVKEVGVTYSQVKQRPITADEVTNKVWDVDEVSRFTALANSFPELLTHDEQRRWKFISAHDQFWKFSTAGESPHIGESEKARLVKITDMLNGWSEKRRTEPTISQPTFQSDDWFLMYRALQPQGVRVPNNLLIRATWDLIEDHAIHGEKFDWNRFHDLAEILRKGEEMEGNTYGA